MLFRPDEKRATHLVGQLLEGRNLALIREFTDLEKDVFPLIKLIWEDDEEVLRITVNSAMSGNTGVGRFSSSDPETKIVNIKESSIVKRVRLTSAVTVISWPNADPTQTNKMMQSIL